MVTHIGDALKICQRDGVAVTRKWLHASLCDDIVDSLEPRFRPLQPGGGTVYELYEGVLPKTAIQLGEELAAGIVRHVDRQRGVPSGHARCESEIVRYFEGQGLTMHRDREGLSQTKALVTLRGTGLFRTDALNFSVRKGDLVLIRGRDMLDVPTPLHGTAACSDRVVLLVGLAYGSRTQRSQPPAFGPHVKPAMTG